MSEKLQKTLLLISLLFLIFSAIYFFTGGKAQAATDISYNNYWFVSNNTYTGIQRGDILQMNYPYDVVFEQADGTPNYNFGYSTTTLSTNNQNRYTYDQIIPCNDSIGGGVSGDGVDPAYENWFVDEWNASSTGGLGRSNCTATNQNYYLVIYDSAGDQPIMYFWTLFVDSTGNYSSTVGLTDGPIGYDYHPVNSTSTIDSLTLECDPNDNFFSRSICGLAVYLLNPNPSAFNNFQASLDELNTKLPFSAVTQFYDGWTSATGTSATPASLTLNFYGEEINVVSSSSLSNIAGSSTNNLRAMIAVGLWVLLGFFLFHRVKNLF